MNLIPDQLNLWIDNLLKIIFFRDKFSKNYSHEHLENAENFSIKVQ